MNLRIWSIYRESDGAFTGRQYGATSAEDLADNLPEGCAAIEGQFDHTCQRVDKATGAVIDFIPPSPGADYEWNADLRRYRLTAAAEQAINADRQARAVIAEQESRQLRAIRELLLNPNDAGAMQRLRDIDSAISAARPAIRR